MKTFNFCLICIAFFTMISCNQSINTNTAEGKKMIEKVAIPTDWETLTDPQYTMNYPTDWHLDHSGQMGTLFILFSPSDAAQDDFKENFTLMLEELPSTSINLEAYAFSSVKQIDQLITEAKITTNEIISTNGRDAYKLIYEGKQGTLNLKFLQYLFVKEKKAFVLTFTAKQDSYERYEELALQMINTFMLQD